jgi:hypothetical protein
MTIEAEKIFDVHFLLIIIFSSYQAQLAEVFLEWFQTNVRGILQPGSVLRDHKIALLGL